MYGSALSFLRSLCLAGGLAFCGLAYAETANVAVAANFRPAMETLEQVFERQTGHEIQVSYGSTGQFFAQIRHGAPFDLFLAADAERPQRLAAAEHSTLPRTYAIGRLALWSPRLDIIDASTLGQAELQFIAIANEELAPYGSAARTVLSELDLAEALNEKLVRGSNVAQAFVFTQTGNADLGFVALSQILSLPEDKQGAHWLPPATLYKAIQQDALLLERGQDNPAATGFFEFLFSDAARDIIQDAGYNLP